MTPIRSATTAAVIGATSASILTALIFSSTAPAPEPTPTATVAPFDTPTPGTPSPTPEPTAEPTPAPTDPTPEPTEPRFEVKSIGGTIRWTNKRTWNLISDAGHSPYGISRVQVLKDRVRVHYDFTAAQVRDFDVSVDEAYASAGVRAGVSVGVRYADVYFYMGTKSAPVNPALLSKKNANIWIGGSFSVPATEPPPADS